MKKWIAALAGSVLLGGTATAVALNPPAAAVEADVQWFTAVDPETGQSVRCLDRLQYAVWCYLPEVVVPTTTTTTTLPVEPHTTPAAVAAEPQVFACIGGTWMRVTVTGFEPSGDPAACEALDPEGIEVAIMTYKNCLNGIETWRCE